MKKTAVKKTTKKKKSRKRPEILLKSGFSFEQLIAGAMEIDNKERKK